MRWIRAVHHVETLVQACSELLTRPTSMFRFRVTQVWVTGDLLGPARDDLELVTLALCVDLSPEDVPWLSEPSGCQHWANATGATHQPLQLLWRSAEAPVWNHRIDRPALVWDATTGPREEALEALRAGRGELVRIPAPAEDLARARHAEELSICLASLRSASRAYRERRWSPGKLTPLSDALLHASEGYLDLVETTI